MWRCNKALRADLEVIGGQELPLCCVLLADNLAVSPQRLLDGFPHFIFSPVSPCLWSLAEGKVWMSSSGVRWD